MFGELKQIGWNRDLLITAMLRADELSPYCPTADCLVNREAILEEPVQRVPITIVNVELSQFLYQTVTSVAKLL
jgi:hypothetical protein